MVADNLRFDDVVAWTPALRSALDVAHGNNNNDFQAITLSLIGACHACHALTQDWRVVDNFVESLSATFNNNGSGEDCLSIASSFWGALMGISVVAQYLGQLFCDTPLDIEAAVCICCIVCLLF